MAEDGQAADNGWTTVERQQRKITRAAADRGYNHRRKPGEKGEQSAAGIRRGAGQWAMLQKEREQATRSFRDNHRLLIKAILVGKGTEAVLEISRYKFLEEVLFGVMEVNTEALNSLRSFPNKVWESKFQNRMGFLEEICREKGQGGIKRAEMHSS